jgi:hypothetical protein
MPNGDVEALRAFRSWRLLFCKDLLSHLPRELRDMIYEFFFGAVLEPGPTVQLLSPQVYWTTIPSHHRYSITSKKTIGIIEMGPNWDTELNELFQQRIVGPAFSGELGQALYERVTFDVQVPTLLDIVANNNFFGDLDVYHGYPRSLRIQFWGRLQSKFKPRGIYVPSDKLTAQEERLHVVLAGGCHRKRLAIELVLHSCISYGRFLCIFAPMIYTLKAAGVRVRLVCYLPVRQGVPQVGTSGTEEDVTALFDQPKKDFPSTIWQVMAEVCTLTLGRKSFSDW